VKERPRFAGGHLEEDGDHQSLLAERSDQHDEARVHGALGLPSFTLESKSAQGAWT
jgi:hypothetical protein